MIEEKTVLIVEDNPENLYIATYIMKKVGCQYVTAGDGLEAIEMARKHAPDLILMDINLPTLSGYETTTRLRQMPEFKDTPIIAVTALSMTGDKEKCIEAGCNDYISKPIDPFSFIELVKQYLSA